MGFMKILASRAESERELRQPERCPQQRRGVRWTPHEYLPLLEFLLWRLRRMWRLIVPWIRKLARSDWRRRLRLPRCWRWAMLWLLRLAKSAGSRRMILRICIREESWGSDWRAWNH